MSDKHKLYIGFIGDSGVGKSQIINRYIKGEFSNEYSPNVALSFSKFETAEPNEYSISVIEFPNNEEAFKTYKEQIDLINCFILVFDLSNPNSYSSIEKYLPLVKNKLFICYGTKSDQIPNPNEVESSIKEKYHLTNFLIGNSSMGYNNDELFSLAVNMIEDQLNKPDTQPNSVRIDQNNTESKNKSKSKTQNEVPETNTSQCCLLI